MNDEQAHAMGTALETVERQAMQRSSGVVMPVASPEEMHNAMVTYQRMKEAVLDRSDYQDAGGGKKFVKKSGWAKLAIAFGVSSSIKDGYPKFFHADDGTLARAEFVVIATAPNGRYAEGWGSCSKTESRFNGPRGNVSKLEHDLPATAETRARNRAYAALFGHGEVSYEEVQLLGADDDVADADFRPIDDGQGRGYGRPPADTSVLKLPIQREMSLICQAEQIDSADLLEQLQKTLKFSGPISAQLQTTQQRVLDTLTERRKKATA